MQESKHLDLEILCPTHQEKIISFSLTSQPQCQKCLTQSEIPIDQFIQNLDNYRKNKMTFLKQQQEIISKQIMQFKKLLVKSKEDFVQSIDILIKNIDEKKDNLLNEFSSEINKLSKAISSLQISELQQYSKEINIKYSTESQQQENKKIQCFIIEEYEKLQIQANILQQLQDLQKQNEGLPSSERDITICVPQDTKPEQCQNQGVVQVPFCISCPKQCSCKYRNSRYWYHQICGGPLFIDKFGNINCLNKCQQFFIQYAKFKCGNQTQKYDSAEYILLQFAQTPLNNIKFFTSYEIFVDFWTNLNQSLVKNWVK